MRPVIAQLARLYDCPDRNCGQYNLDELLERLQVQEVQRVDRDDVCELPINHGYELFPLLNGLPPLEFSVTLHVLLRYALQFILFYKREGSHLIFSSKIYKIVLSSPFIA